jgi:ADP-heptose:LPS heptosyltransferase
MSSNRSINNQTWHIATFDQPMVLDRIMGETWLFNPVRRYVLNASLLPSLQGHIATLSNLKGSAAYRPLHAGGPIAGGQILIERFRERGIGDLIFLTGPVAFLQNITGNRLGIDIYSFADRGSVFTHNPGLRHRSALLGPTHYDDLPHYNFHWFVDPVTEEDEEPDQLNVYDALYTQIGLNPAQVDPIYKRPYLYVTPEEHADLDRLFLFIWHQRQIDLRRTGYYVASPLTHSPLRLMNYSQWLEVITEAARRRPVIVTGDLHHRVPDTDISVGEFVSELDKLGNQVINGLGTPMTLRLFFALTSKAKAAITLDSGPLYVAQALRVPAVSLWGAHDPGVRIGYDPDYMDLAIWNQDHCQHSPCFAYSGFPQHKCPRGSKQAACEVLMHVTAAQVMEKLDKIEAKACTAGPVFLGAKYESTAPTEIAPT